MNVLVFNCGSSSQGFKLYRAEGRGGPGQGIEVLAAGKARNVATRTLSAGRLEWDISGVSQWRELELGSHAVAAEAVLSLLGEASLRIDAVGHRFVHGGTLFSGTTPIDASTIDELRATAVLAPIHNPNSLSVIDVCRAAMPEVPQYAVFDTTFFAALPAAAYTYGLPGEISKRFGWRRYGFHGLSYQYVSARTAELLGRPLEDLAMVVAHLGTGGSSVAAIEGGRAVDTSIGTTMSGLVMSTRCGDIAPEIPIEAMRAGLGADEIEDMFANCSGLLGLSGVSSNLLEVIAAAEQGDAACRLAFEVYSHRLAHYIGAFFWLVGGADAIVFTDDAGTRAWQVREAACGSAGALGVELDLAANRSAVGAEAVVSTAGSATSVLVVPTDEEVVIATEVLKKLEVVGC